MNKNIVQKNLEKVKNKIFKLNIKDNIEECISLISVYCELQYRFNQIYSDIEIEKLLDDLSVKILGNIDNYSLNQNIVFFYDGFGLDLRGWAVSYVKALSSLQYKIVYITSANAEGHIPHILKELKKNKVEYINTNKSYTDVARELNGIFEKYRPSSAFFYTTPNDISGAIVFNHYKGLVKRFQIDLTDHAFWLGVNAADYFLECREMGASLATYERNVAKDRIIKIDCAPYINLDQCEEPLPFDICKDKYIFTGGSLYKTLGDSNHAYYKIIDLLLSEFKTLKFLYAGSGDTSEINKLIRKYPGRAYLIKERSDFYRLFQHCELYINTYPMFGGLMMRYAALASKVPITLRHDHDADGILENQDDLNVQFDTIEEVILEARKLLMDSQYYRERSLMINKSVINDKTFARNINLILDKQSSEYKFDIIPRIDTSEFRQEYVNRFRKEDFYTAFSSKKNKKLLKVEPLFFIIGALFKWKERRK